ncbi:MAG: rod shape-determining protein MreC [bacterium]|nr:rod shape-determining protein MreC [bacterium]
MNLFRRNNTLQGRWPTRTGRKSIFIATLIVCALIVFDALSGGSVRSLVRHAGATMWSAGVSVGNSIFGSGLFTTRRALIAENASLSEQIAQFQEQAAAYRVLQAENNTLRDMLNVAEIQRGQNRDAGITAPIISSFRASPYGTFQIGAGTADSVAPGNLVLSAENFVIGRIETADANSSLAREIFAPNISTDAVLHGVGVAVLGQGGGNARTDVPRQTDVSLGDPVVSAPLGSRAIGVVGKVTEDSGDAYKRVQIYLPVNLSVLQFVYVVKK